MTNRYRHIFVLLSQLVLTVPNSANFRKGGDHLRIKDNTQTRTDNHTQKNQKGTDKRTNAKLNIAKQDAETGNEAQGDATLEGAVYGLYAREDIVHPDGRTGTIYKEFRT